MAGNQADLGVRQRPGRGHPGLAVDQRHFADDLAAPDRRQNALLVSRRPEDFHLAGDDKIGHLAELAFLENEFAGLDFLALAGGVAHVFLSIVKSVFICTLLWGLFTTTRRPLDQFVETGGQPLAPILGQGVVVEPPFQLLHHQDDLFRAVRVGHQRSQEAQLLGYPLQRLQDHLAFLPGQRRGRQIEEEAEPDGAVGQQVEQVVDGLLDGQVASFLGQGDAGAADDRGAHPRPAHEPVVAGQLPDQGGEGFPVDGLAFPGQGADAADFVLDPFQQHLAGQRQVEAGDHVVQLDDARNRVFRRLAPPAA